MKTREIAAAFAILFIVGLAGTAISQNNPKTPPGANSADQQLQQMLNDQEAILKRSASLLTVQEEFMKRQDIAFKRYEKILETWEQQQQQYQRYLDSLAKK